MGRGVLIKEAPEKPSSRAGALLLMTKTTMGMMTASHGGLFPTKRIIMMREKIMVIPRRILNYPGQALVCRRSGFMSRMHVASSIHIHSKFIGSMACQR
uniref:Uncharacterized protein n=1 Tax=Picea sitchensis TaxID=3332 RepID=A9NSF6_PICSI|nr:unknown [Picea sitchensis]